MRKTIAAGLMAAMMMAPVASAQTPTGMPTDADDKAALANQLGVLEYCQGKGYVTDAQVQADRQVVQGAPGGDPASAVKAEALGRQGTLSMMGTTKPIADQASAQNESVQQLCQNLGAIAAQLGAAFQQMPQMPAMPSSP